MPISIDTDSVCGHMLAVMSGKVNLPSIQRAIGRLNSLPPGEFKQVCSELGHIFTCAMRGEFEISPSQIPHIALAKGKCERQDRFGNTQPGNLYKEEWINELLALPPCDETFFIWSSLTNLKSAIVQNELSRTEQKEAYDNFIHTTSIPQEVRSNWIDFCKEFTVELLANCDPNTPRRYETMCSIPRSQKRTCSLNKSGRLISCRKGDADSTNLLTQIRHPDIHRLALLHPERFAESTILGYTTADRFFIELPDPFEMTLPIGRASIAPKRAQKARTVYIPLTVLDCLSRPAFFRLKELINRWSLQSVKSHDNGRNQIRERLIKNINKSCKETFCSIDQSAFTDNFSYDFIQREVLKSLVEEEYLLPFDLDTIDTINHGLWDITALGRKYELASFGTGTGMGTPPSFMLASLANGYLLAYAYKHVKGSFPSFALSRQPGIVVGDDICIFNDEIGQAYKDLCQAIGLKLNETKSFESDHCAEFCGKFICPEGIYDKHKLLNTPDLDNLIDLWDYYDDKAELFEIGRTLDKPELLTDRMYYLDVVRQIPEPYGLKPFDYNDFDFDNLSSLERSAVAHYQISRMSSWLPPEQAVDRRSLAELNERKARQPKLSSQPRPLILEEDEEKPNDIPLYYRSVVANAINLWKYQKMRHADLTQAARLLNDVYTTFTSIHPEWVDFQARTTEGLGQPRKSKDRFDFGRLIEVPEVVNTSTLLKGGDDSYEPSI